MEIKSKNSKIVFEEDNITSHTKNYLGVNKYLSVKYKNIRGVSILHYKYFQVIPYICGISSIQYGFEDKIKQLDNQLGRKSLGLYTQTTVEASMSEMILFTLLGIGCIILGFYYFNIKIKNKRDILIKYFEGKNKKASVFTSDNDSQIDTVKNEIENRV